MSGLFAGIFLRRAGWVADIYERVDVGLIGRGAGIVTHAEMRALLSAAGCDPGRDLGVEVSMRRTLDRSGAVLGDFVCPQTMTSWDRVFRMLRQGQRHLRSRRKLGRPRPPGARCRPPPPWRGTVLACCCSCVVSLLLAARANLDEKIMSGLGTNRRNGGFSLYRGRERQQPRCLAPPAPATRRLGVD